MISTRSAGLLIDTVVCLTLAKWETVSGRFGGYLKPSKRTRTRRRQRLCPWSSWKPPRLRGHFACIAAYLVAACDGRHEFGEYIVERAEHVSVVIAKNYSRRASTRSAPCLMCAVG